MIRVGSLALIASMLATGCREEPIPSLMPIGAFSLVDQDGQAFGSAELSGHVYVADFVFTSCPDVCPVMTSQMANLHRRMEEVRFVSVSVDPAADTPERLREYAARFRADTTRWRFLTGAPDEVRRVIEREFRLPVGEREPLGPERSGPAGYDIMHNARFLLVDRRGVLRGLYETDGDGMDRLERDARRLLREEP